LSRESGRDCRLWASAAAEAVSKRAHPALLPQAAMLMAVYPELALGVAGEQAAAEQWDAGLELRPRVALREPSDESVWRRARSLQALLEQASALAVQPAELQLALG
jgi:hypothetical protein